MNGHPSQVVSDEWEHIEYRSVIPTLLYFAGVRVSSLKSIQLRLCPEVLQRLEILRGREIPAQPWKDQCLGNFRILNVRTGNIQTKLSYVRVLGMKTGGAHGSHPHDVVLLDPISSSRVVSRSNFLARKRKGQCQCPARREHHVTWRF